MATRRYYSMLLLFYTGLLVGVILDEVLRAVSNSTNPSVKLTRDEVQFKVGVIETVVSKSNRPEDTTGLHLNAEEECNVKQCVQTKDEEYRKSQIFWYGNRAEQRFSVHKYLNSTSVIIDVGGNIGIDTEQFVKRYGSRILVFEPLKPYYTKLKEKFSNNTRVRIVNFGLGKKDEEVTMEIKGNDGDASSLYRGENQTSGEKVKIKNTTRFMEEIELETLNIDLFHVNCEGCEFDVLEELVRINKIYNLKHVQFATHTQYTGIENVVFRYCRLQEILKRSHKLMYQYKFVWESWEVKRQC